MRERRAMANRPYRKSAEGDYLATIGLTFVVGAMLGAVITLGAITSGVIVL